MTRLTWLGVNGAECARRRRAMDVGITSTRGRRRRGNRWTWMLLGTGPVGAGDDTDTLETTVEPLRPSAAVLGREAGRRGDAHETGAATVPVSTADVVLGTANCGGSVARWRRTDGCAGLCARTASAEENCDEERRLHVLSPSLCRSRSIALSLLRIVALLSLVIVCEYIAPPSTRAVPRLPVVLSVSWPALVGCGTGVAPKKPRSVDETAMVVAAIVREEPAARAVPVQVRDPPLAWSVHWVVAPRM